MSMEHSSSAIVEKIHSLDPVISQLLAISGSPCLSIGVLHRGEVIYTNHRGKRDISKPHPPDDDTIYQICSLTKILTASAAALLVEEGHISWDTPLHEILPELKVRDDRIGQEATLIDILSNRTGIAIANRLWGICVGEGEFLLPRSDLTRTCCDLQAPRPFRETFYYSQWNYWLAEAVVEKVSGQSFSSYLQEKFLDPLNMQRTSLGLLHHSNDDNIAMSHAVKSDGTLCKIPFTDISDRTGMAASSGGKSTMKDLLTMYKALLSAYRHQTHSGETSTPNSPFKQLQTVFSPHIKIAKSEKQAYCLGIYKTILPGNVSLPSFNNAFLGRRNLPIAGSSHSGVEVFHHTGNLIGSTQAMFLIPSSETAIVVSSNSWGLSDVTDFTGRLILSIILKEPIPTTFVDLSKCVRATQFSVYANLNAQLEKGKTMIPPQHPLSAYTGKYFNKLGNYCLEVKAKEGGLLMIAQGKKRSRLSFLPYDGNTFYWPYNRDKQLDTFGYVTPDWYKISFHGDSEGIQSLAWNLDAAEKPEVFNKRSNEYSAAAKL